METKRYTFKVTVSGEGLTPQHAWNNAAEVFAIDPGCCPEDFEIEEIENEEEVGIN